MTLVSHIPIFAQFNRLTAKELIKCCNWIKCRVQLLTHNNQTQGRDCSSRLSSLTLGRKSRFTDVQITCLEEYPWHRSTMREMYHWCVVDATYMYKRTHNSVSGISRNRSLFQEHCHDYSRCRNGTERNVRYEHSPSSLLNHSNREINLEIELFRNKMTKKVEYNSRNA